MSSKPLQTLAGVALVGLLLPSAVVRASSWSSSGPDGGSVVAVTLDPTAPSTAYAGTEHGGLFKSLDGGSSWAAVSDPLLPIEVGALAVATDGTVYVAAGEGASGVFKSADGGATWTEVQTIEALSIATDPSSAGTLYLGTSGLGVFKSTDAGASWTSSTAGLVDLSLASLVVDPTSSVTLYAASPGDGVVKSLDGGSTWTAASSSAFEVVTDLAIDNSVTPILYVGTLFAGVYKSADGGGTWSSANTDLPDRIDCVAADPQLPSRLFAGAFGRLFRSDDAGATWTELTSGVPGTEMNDIQIDSSSGAVITATDSGVLSSADGTTWVDSNAGLRAVKVDRLVPDPVSPDVLYAGSASGAFKTDNGGQSWTRADAGVADRRIAALALAPGQPQVLYAASGDRIHRSNDGGSTWVDPIADPADFGLFGPSVLSLVVSSTSPDTVSAGNPGLGGRGGDSGIYQSIDGGVSWTQVFEFPGGLREVRPASGTSDPAVPGRQFFGYTALVISATSSQTKVGILRSDDGGATWTEVFSSSDGTELDVRVSIDPFSPDTVYAVVTKETTPQIVRSTDGGDTWLPLTVGAPGVRDLLPDPNDAGTIWAASDPVYVSEDNGATWALFDTTGFPTVGNGAAALAVTGTMPATVHAATTTGAFSYRLAVPVDLEITKDDGLTEISPGDPMTYTVSVENLGPGDVTAADVSDLLPVELACSWTCMGSGGGICTAGPVAGDVVDLVDLPLGAEAVYTIDCTLDGGATGSLVNTATVEVNGDYLDPQPSNDSASDSDVVLTVGACGTFDHRALSNSVLDTPGTVIEACETISAGPAVELVPSADVVFRAGTSVTLMNGFSVAAGVPFSVLLESPGP